jgi:site-specific recombinase XerD
MNSDKQKSDTDITEEKIQGLPLITEPVEKRLNERQLLDYAAERRDMLTWLLQQGKDPRHGEGYSPTTLKDRRIDQFYRWVWNHEDGYTSDIKTRHANRYDNEFKLHDTSNEDKNQRIKALKRLFNWLHHCRNCEQWNTDVTFKTEDNNPKDFLRMKERKKIRQASLEYESIPGYNNLSPERRDRWKAHIAQKLGKPKEHVTESDWDRINGWKIPSLVYVSLDCGLRPIEVQRSTVDWVDLDNGELQIPKEYSAKNRENWNPVLTEKTQQFLRRWLNQRRTIKRYDDSDAIWLTRKGNPYRSHSLKHLLMNLAEEAGLDTENRSFYWYMIRHSTGTYMTHGVSGKAAEAQLRSSIASDKYDQAPPELRREGLEEIG